MGNLPPNPRWRGISPPDPPSPHFIQTRPTAVYALAGSFHVYKEVSWTLLSGIEALYKKGQVIRRNLTILMLEYAVLLTHVP